MDNPKNKIALALSGGVDSSVAADILQKNGYSVVGVYFVMSEASIAGAKEAQNVAQSLGIEFHVVDIKERFEDIVINYFCQSYCSGKTPNPCIICNPNVKFHALAEFANNHDIQKIATGHYANVRNDGNFSILCKADYVEKDQSYMLSTLSQAILNRVVFPLGNLTKPEVRERAAALGLISANKPDSQEICFIPDNDYPNFLKKRGVFGAKGDFILTTGQRLKPHNGVECYTVGQRRGLNLSYKHPLYVNEISENGDILVSANDELFKQKVLIKDLKTSSAVSLSDGDEVLVKLRSAAKPAAAVVSEICGGELSLAFETPQRAPAKGQQAVLYINNDVVASGEIVSSER